MHASFRAVIVLIVLACAMSLCTRSVLGQSSEWDSVARLPAGVALRIGLRSGDSRRGQFVEASGDRLTVNTPDGPIDIARTSLQRVYRVHERTVRRYALRGLIIGGGAGAILGATTAKTDKGQWTALMALGWSAVGALIGAIDGLDHREELIFQAVVP